MYTDSTYLPFEYYKTKLIFNDGLYFYEIILQNLPSMSFDVISVTLVSRNKLMQNRNTSAFSITELFASHFSDSFNDSISTYDSYNSAVLLFIVLLLFLVWTLDVNYSDLIDFSLL